LKLTRLALPSTPKPCSLTCKQVEEFVGISSSLLINMGTLSSDWLASKKLAAKRVSGAAWRMGFNLLSAALTHTAHKSGT